MHKWTIISYFDGYLCGIFMQYELFYAFWKKFSCDTGRGVLYLKRCSFCPCQMFK